ncbi:MAG: porin [Boseongicola sp.]
MKKVLLASTALVATSSFAAAQGVELSGSAEMGIINGSSFTGTEFFSDIDVKFSLSGETDNGLTFGATIDLDEVGDDHDTSCSGGGDPIAATPFSGCATQEHSVFISGAFGTLTMGDTDGAYDWALSEVGIGTAIADDHTTHAGFNGNSGLDGGNDGQIARYDYSFGDFVAGVSVELDDTGGGVGDIIAIGGRWSGGVNGSDLAIGLGYQDSDVADIFGFSVRGGTAGFIGIFNYSDHSVTGDHIGLGLGYETGGLLVSGNWGEFDGGVDGFGIAVNYDLGGGAQVQFGYGDDNTGFDQWSFGLSMAF